jgi:hypothetical protein
VVNCHRVMLKPSDKMRNWRMTAAIKEHAAAFRCMLRIFFLTLSVSGLVTGQSVAGTGAEIWASFPPGPDFMQLFSTPALWAQSLRHVSVLKLQTQFSVNASDHTLQTIFRFLADQHIALALEAPMQTSGPDGCGEGVEGYRPSGLVHALIERFRGLGANLRYVAMDEPLWFGHFASRPRRSGLKLCHATIAMVADNVALSVAAIRDSYPQVLVGDEEPIPNFYRNTLPTDFWDQTRDWMTAFARATGRPLAFMDFDVGWFSTGFPITDRQNQATWPSELRQGLSLLNARQIRSGIFYNGDPSAKTGREWVDEATQRFKEVEGTYHIHPDSVTFQTWMRYPKSNLPETAPGTMTNLILRYLKFGDELGSTVP